MDLVTAQTPALPASSVKPMPSPCAQQRTTPGCLGDAHYPAPGRGHLARCTYPLPGTALDHAAEAAIATVVDALRALGRVRALLAMADADGLPIAAEDLRAALGGGAS